MANLVYLKTSRVHDGLLGLFASLCFVIFTTPNLQAEPVTFRPQRRGLRDAATPTPTPKPRKPIYPGFGRFKSEFQAVCEELALDGRRRQFFEMMVAHDVRDDDCTACKPLFGSFAKACKQRKESRRKRSVHAGNTGEETPTPTPTPTPEPRPQRDPRTELIDLVSRLFVAIAALTHQPDQTILGVQRFVAVLRDPQGKDAATKDYFDTIAEYAASPFEPSTKKNDTAAASTPVPRGNIDDLFDR